MTIRSPEQFYAAIVPDPETGIRLRHVFIEPPIDATLAQQIAIATRMQLIDLTSTENQTRFVARPHEVSDSSQRILVNLDRVMRENEKALVPFPGLDPDASWTDFRLYMSRRKQERAE